MPPFAAQEAVMEAVKLADRSGCSNLDAIEVYDLARCVVVSQTKETHGGR